MSIALVLQDFQQSNDELQQWLSTINDLKSLSSINNFRIKSRSQLVTDAKRIRSRLRKIGRNWEVAALEGVFLNSCFQFEHTTRKLIEAGASALVVKAGVFNKLPSELKKAYPKKVSSALKRLSQPSFAHLNFQDVCDRLGSCGANSVNTPDLVLEALSHNERNLRVYELSDLCKGLGIADLRGQISQESTIATFFGLTTNDANALKSLWTNELDQIIQERNNIVHRNRNYGAAVVSASNVDNNVRFFRALIDALGNVINTHVTAFTP